MKGKAATPYAPVVSSSLLPPRGFHGRWRNPTRAANLLELFFFSLSQLPNLGSNFILKMKKKKIAISCPLLKLNDASALRGGG